jgi:hypothetical protein
MAKVEGDSENITDAMRQENSTAISKIRSLFVDPGFPASQPEDAGSAVPSEKVKDGDQYGAARAIDGRSRGRDRRIQPLQDRQSAGENAPCELNRAHMEHEVKLGFAGCRKVGIGIALTK